MKIKSYAKINLCLKVYPKDNVTLKHSIDSIFCLYKNLYDQIEIHPSNSSSINYLIDGKLVKLNDCLVSKTLNYLHAKYGWNINFDILIKKNIPIGAGLGGASSNAAAITNYLLNQNKLVSLDLKEIAIELGSDIPFFLTQYTIARVKRFGEYVTPLSQINQDYELILTSIPCSTKAIFQLLDEDETYSSQVDVDKIWNNILNKQHNNVVYNDLTKYIIKSNYKLQEWLDQNPQSWFSGSGGTLVKIKEK